MTATGLADLDRKRAEAATRIEEIEGELRQARLAVQEAAAALSDVERQGKPASARKQAEADLATARLRAEDPALPARASGRTPPGSRHRR